MEGVDASRALGAVYRRAVRELDNRGLREFLLARAEMLLHFPKTDSLEVFMAEHLNQVAQLDRLLTDTLALRHRPRRSHRSAIRIVQ